MLADKSIFEVKTDRSGFWLIVLGHYLCRSLFVYLRWYLFHQVNGRLTITCWTGTSLYSFTIIEKKHYYAMFLTIQSYCVPNKSLKMYLKLFRTKNCEYLFF